jgi:hypothetical protein
MWLALDRRFERVPVAAIVALALLVRMLAALASPLLEDDHYRYLWDGLRSATALDPYRLAPEAFFGDAGLAPQWQDILSGINHPELPTIYGPLLQMLFALGYWLAPGELAPLQVLLVTIDMAVLAVLAMQRVPARWLLAYALHPLVLKEAIASAHPDGLVALCLLLALASWQRRRAAWVGAMLGLAIGAKVAALVALPLLMLAPALRDSAPRAAVRWALIVCAACAATVLALYAPFLLGGGSDATALGAFGTQWRFNPLLYRAFEGALPAAAARPAAALCVMAGIAVIAWQWQRRDAVAAPPLHAAFLLLLLFSPVVNPWYWLWTLPLAVFAQRAGVLAIGVVAVLSYLNSSVLGATAWAESVAPYNVAWPLAAVQLAVLLAAWRIRIAVSAPAPRASK